MYRTSRVLAVVSGLGGHMYRSGKAALPVVAVVALLVVGAPSSLWANVTPEIDPSSGMSALALLAGAVAVIRGWRKK
jgi:hypothetical protein